jgi:hypothetical protein
MSHHGKRYEYHAALSPRRSLTIMPTYLGDGKSNALAKFERRIRSSCHVIAASKEKSQAQSILALPEVP